MLETLTQPLFKAIAILSVISWFCILLVIILRLTNSEHYKKISFFLSDKGTSVALVIAVISTLSSLYLSEIAGLIPCELCWFQRIMMYPLVIILAVSIYKKINIRPAALSLAIIGAGIAAYHYSVQILSRWSVEIPCTSAGECSIQYLNYFGFISIPLMAFTAFILIIIALSVGKE